jgi:glycosyltransferase involved in cell wall biosynthesis
VSILDLIPVRVALFAEWDPGIAGGLATTIAGLLDHLPGDIRIIPHVSRPGLSALLGVDEVVACIRQHRAELLHIATSGPAALAALFVAGRLGLPVVGSFDVDALTATSLRRRYLRTLTHLCDKVLVSSCCARSALSGLADSQKIGLWRPGVDTETFTPRKRSAELREEWQVSQDRAAVVYAGTLSEEHGASRLLALEMALRRSYPMHRLIVAGDGPALSELRYRCPQALFLGHVPDVRMPEVLASADVFVSPSERQSTHHALLEAQASGLPVVVMAKGAARERVTPAAAVVCRSEADFIVYTAALIRTETRRIDMARAAREYAMLQQWESGLAPLYAAYRTAVASSTSVRGKLVGVVREQGINS